MHLALGSCTIRSWVAEDTQSLVTHANDHEIWLQLRDRFPHPYTIEDANIFLERVLHETPETSFAIDVSGQAVGCISAMSQTDVHRFTAEIGYWLGKEFWGRGIMTEVVPAFTEWLFETFALHRIYASSFARNRRSARVLEKAGFEYEGCLRASVFKDGQILDQLLYAKTKRGHQALP